MIVTAILGGSAANASISNKTITDTGTFGVDTIFARYKLDNTGLAYTIRNTVDAGVDQAIAGEWLTAGSPGDCECFATLNSGSLSTGTTGSWLDLSTQRVWRRDATGVGTASADLTITIRDKNTGAILDSANIVLNATGL